jgi:hypothetical protein
MDYSAISAFSTNENFPKAVKNALVEAARLMADVKTKKDKLEEAQRIYQDKLNEQERTRKNIDTVGSESAVGKDYIKKLIALDNEIEKAFNQISEDKASVLKAQKAFDNYIKGLEAY